MINITFIVSSTDPKSGVGDYFTAIELGSALTYKYDCIVNYLAVDDDLSTLRFSNVIVVMIHDFNLNLMPISKNDLNNITLVCWARNWFQKWEDAPWIQRYNILFASSKYACTYLTNKVGKHFKLLRIATNNKKFNIAHENGCAEKTWDLVFTGSYWGHPRDIIKAVETIGDDYSIAFFGKGWEKVSSVSNFNMGYIEYNALPSIYKNSLIVIDDANHTTKSWGAANSRVFDAIASGCLVITNSTSVSQEVFSGLLPAYSSDASLRELIRCFTNDHNYRTDIINKLQREVFSKHLYRHRAIEFGINLKLPPRRKF